ncbi:MAG: hypothetical protein PHY47_15520 [Lachnospiraceae bacterium]|nr:hypothetical protein [Lachnospiraceae bacterium]
MSVKFTPYSNGRIQLYYNNQSGTDSYFDESHSEIKEIVESDRIITFSKSLTELEKIRLDFKRMKEISIDEIVIKSCGIPLIRFNPNEINRIFNLRYAVQVDNKEEQVLLKIISDPAYIGTADMPTQKVRIRVLIMAWIISIIVVSFMRNKIFKHTSVDNILIAFTIFILIVPTLIWNIILPENNVTNENRVLKDKPELKLNKIIDYPSEMNDYVNDHLPFKQNIVTINSFIKYKLLSMSPEDYVIKGKDDWLFYNSKARGETDSLGDYLGTIHYKKEELEIIKNELLEKQKYFSDRGIEFYIMLCPNKEQIYSEYMPDYFVVQNPESRLDELVSYLEENTDIPIIYLKQKLIENKNNNRPLYFKWDTHWNNAGGYVGFYELMKAMGRQQGILSYSEMNFTQYERLDADMTRMINMTPGGKDYNYNPENFKNDIEAINKKTENDATYYMSNGTDKEKIILYRDSFGEALIPYISKTFNDSIFITNRIIDNELIESEKPDIIVYEVVERGIEVLKNF